MTLVRLSPARASQMRELALVAKAQLMRLARALAMRAPTPAVADDSSALIRAGTITIAAFFGVFLVWAALAPMSGAAVGLGFVKVQGNRQSVQHADGGTVREILVAEGQRVARGDVVLRLDDTIPRARHEQLAAEWREGKALEARLRAERDGAAEPDFAAAFGEGLAEPQVSRVVANQRALFEERTRRFATERAVRGQRIAQLRAEIDGLNAEIAGKERQLALIADELSGLRRLFERGHTTRTRILALERAEAQLGAERGVASAGIARAEQAIGEAELAIVAAERTRTTEIATELREAEARLARVTPELAAARATLERTVLRAPASGEVVGLTAFTVGGVVAAGARVLDIVPSESPLVFEARIAPQDIEEVAVGSRAEIRMTGIADRHRPVLAGTVVTVSADRLTDPRTGAGYFAVELRPDAPVAGGRPVALQPGMPAQVMIATRSRTLLDYLLAPLTDEIARGFREE